MAVDYERIEVRLTGRVQGVGFRAFTRRAGRSLERVTGWVRNEPDGSVKLVAEGPPDNLDSLLRSVREGPRHADVENVSVSRSEPTGEFDRFTIRY